MAFNTVGSTGLRQFSGWVREEFLPVLAGLQGARTYREMLDNDPSVGAVMFSIQSVMRKTVWRTEPAASDGLMSKAGSSNFTSAAEKDAEFADSLRDDMSSTWEDFVIESMSMLGYGFAPMEVVYKRREGPQSEDSDKPTSRYSDGMIGVRKIALRGQDTIIKWFFDNDGSVCGLTQQPWTSGIIDIPMQKLLLFRPMQHKGNPEGRSILRNSYRPWFLKKRMEEAEAIMLERLAGLPVVTIPNEILQKAAAGDAASQMVLASYQKIARGVRVDEQMGIVMPSDPWRGADGQPSSAKMFGFELMTPSGGGRSTTDPNVAITRYKGEILTSTLADFLMLGHEARGTQSLAVTKVDLFMGAVEGYQNCTKAVLNRHHMPRIWALNGLDPATMPEYVPDLAQRVDLDALSNFILRMGQAGMPLFPDENLEDFIRDAAGLPDIGEDMAETRDLVANVASGEDAKAMPPDQMNAAQKKRHDLKKAIRASAARRVKHIGGSAT